MKTLKYFSLFIAAGLFAACSDNLTEGNGDNNDGPKTGEGYVKVAINMPTVSGSRADESFDHGSDNEYAVKTGIIAFFEGEKESDATFVKAYDLGNLENKQVDDTDDSPTPDQISTVVTQIIEAPLKKDSKNTMYALVILNNVNNVAFVDDIGVLNLKNGVNDIILNSNSTIAALNGVASPSNDVEWALNVSDITGDNGFLMLNAPLYKETNVVQTLVPVDVYDDKVEAESAVANKIFVERIVAKVNVKLKEENTPGTLTVKDGIFRGDQVVFYQTDNTDNLGWVLNVTNNNTKPLRDVSDFGTWSSDSYAMKEYVKGSSSELLGGYSRIYWAKDNNYGNIELSDFTIYDKDNRPDNENWGDYTNPQYCLENTNTGTKYLEGNTTSVLIKAKYIINGNDSSDDSFFTMDNVANTMTWEQFKAKIAELLSVNEDNISLVEGAQGGVYDSNNITSLLTINNYSGNYNNIGEVRYYKDGACYYYTIPIQHFSSITRPTTDAVTDENYTGKYGVVRNNWYQITINSVSGPGEPEIPEQGGDPVDKEEGYIKAEINVLSWAKRTQDVDL